MFYDERIDGPPSEKWDEYSDEKLAESVIWGGITRCNWIRHEDPEEERDQGYRVASWVSEHGSTLGRALGISRPQQLFTWDSDAFEIKVLHIKTDRTLHKIIGRPAILAVRTDVDIHDQVPDTLQTYTREQMLYSVAMFEKMNKVAKGETPPGIDCHVGNGLAVGYVDNYVAQKPPLVQ